MLGFSRAKAFDVERLPWATLRKTLAPALEAVVADATAGAVAAALARGLQVDPDVIAAAVAEMMPGYLEAWEAEVVRTSQERVAAAVAAHTAGDIAFDEMIDRVDKVFDADRAALMAVTETTRLYDVVGQVINEASGVERVRFLTVRDPWVCPICSPLDNQVFDIDEAPHPPLDTHPNCRCFLAPEVPEARSRRPRRAAA